MRTARTFEELTAYRTELGHGRPISLVPTMGALHSGHQALLAAARHDDALVVASIFVNPLQFEGHEDYARYPRDEAADIALLEASGCDLLWLPSVATMYPEDDVTEVALRGPALGWEGESRPGHFRGVATVVAKLFGQVRPARAFFGEKDWQQLQVVRRMTRDLYLGVEIVAIPTVREHDGLAVSSRNERLSSAERARAPMLHATLVETARSLASGTSIALSLGKGRAALEEAGLAVAYFALVDATSLVPLEAIRTPARLIAAVDMGGVHLIDNIAVA